MEEVVRDMTLKGATLNNANIEEKLTKQSLYKQLALFSRDISSVKLALTAGKAFEKYKNDYMLCSFYNLMEWRISRAAKESNDITPPFPHEYKVVICDQNCFQPYTFKSMRENSELLVEHLVNILRLNSYAPEGSDDDSAVSHTWLPDSEVLEYATQHDLPVFISIDGSYREDGIASTSICIVAPDIRDTDTLDGNEWQNRRAKPLLIRSWRLPKCWGMGKASINMAEALGFIIGEYTIPAEIPVIYVTDSNNARSLQKRIRNSDTYTDQKIVRSIKQGIDYSIANHLEYLTSQWLQED
jgi:hypothetical protein